MLPRRQIAAANEDIARAEAEAEAKLVERDAKIVRLDSTMRALATSSAVRAALFRCGVNAKLMGMAIPYLVKKFSLEVSEGGTATVSGAYGRQSVESAVGPVARIRRRQRLCSQAIDGPWSVCIGHQEDEVALGLRSAQTTQALLLLLGRGERWPAFFSHCAGHRAAGSLLAALLFFGGSGGQPVPVYSKCHTTVPFLPWWEFPLPSMVPQPDPKKPRNKVCAPRHRWGFFFFRLKRRPRSNPVKLFGFSEGGIPGLHQEFQFVFVEIVLHQIVSHQHGRPPKLAVRHLQPLARLCHDDFVPPHFDRKIGHMPYSEQSTLRRHLRM